MFTTAAAILAYVGVKTPSQAETEWAEACAAAVNEGIAIRLNTDPLVIIDPPPAELSTAATMAGGEAYKRREAPFGITGFSDVEGNAVRIARDYLDGIRPIIDRYGNGPGIG